MNDQNIWFIFLYFMTLTANIQVSQHCKDPGSVNTLALFMGWRLVKNHVVVPSQFETLGLASFCIVCALDEVPLQASRGVCLTKTVVRISNDLTVMIHCFFPTLIHAVIYVAFMLLSHYLKLI